MAEEVPMAAYSMDLRTRVLEDSDAGMRADAIAEKYRVSLSWVNRLKQRRRESGEIAPRRQIRWRTPILTPALPRLEALIADQSDRTLAELQHALGTTASLTTIWRAIERLAITIKKNGTPVRTGSRPRRCRSDGLAPGRPGD